MNKNEFFNLAIGTDVVRYKEWIICLFTKFSKSKPRIAGDYPFRLIRDESGKYFANIDGALVAIEDADPNLPLFEIKEPILITKGSMPNITGDVVTTVGLAVVNSMLLCYPFGSKIPYINKKFSVKDIEKIIEPVFMDDVEPGEVEDPTKIYVREYLVFGKMACQISGFASISVPGDTIKSVTGHPDGPKLKAELLEKYKDRLNDPVVAAMIEKELVKLDRSWVDDDAKDVYLSDKVWNNSRKRMFYMHGYEAPFTSEQKGVLLTRSLEEGIDFEQMPAMVNSLYSGSFSRGSETQLGGAKSKDALRIFQNSSISEDDCGTKLALKITVSIINWPSIIGMYMMSGGKPVLITDDMRDTLIGRTIFKRSPERCNTEGLRFCKICAGVGLSKTPTGVGVEMSSVGTTYMTSSLKKMHTGSVSSVRYDIKNALH